MPTEFRLHAPEAALRRLGASAEYLPRPGGHSFRFLNAATPDLLERASEAFLAAPLRPSPSPQEVKTKAR